MGAPEEAPTQSASRILALAARLVPTAQRREWRRQWEAELAYRHRHSEASPGPSPLRWSLGALRHAAWLRARELRAGANLYDLGHAVKALRRRPALTATAALTLAIGVGSTAALFSVVNGVLLRPLPYPAPDELVMVFQQNHDWMESPDPFYQRMGAQFPASYPIYEEWAQQTEALAAVALTRSESHIFVRDGMPRRIYGTAAAGDLPEVLRIEPAHGRWFLQEEDQIGAPRLIVLSDRLWREEFGADPAVVGSTVTLSESEHQIIGVMPPEFNVPNTTEFWTNMADVHREGSWGRAGFEATGRMAPGRDMDSVQKILLAHTRALAESTDALEPMGVRILPRLEFEVGDQRSSFVLLLGAASLLLLIACANVASLLLVRSSERLGEVAVRVALGAGRARILRQFLGESLLLGLLGGAVGAVLAYVFTEQLVELLPHAMRSRPVGVDTVTLAFAAGVAILAGLLVGLIGCVDLLRLAPAECLAAASSRASGSRQQRRALSAVVVAQVGLALVLVVGSGLLLTSLQHLMNAERGFDGDGVTALSVRLPAGVYGDPATINSFGDLGTEELAALPGVTAVAFSDSPPFAGSTSSTTFEIEGREVPEDDFGLSSIVKAVSPGYLGVLGIPRRAGRIFEAGDVADAEPVMVINEVAAQLFFPGEDPIGQRIRRNDEDPWSRVVGVVGNVLHGSLDEDPQPIVYVPFGQAPERSFRFLVAGLAVTEVDATRRAIAAADPLVPIDSVDTVTELIRRQSARPRARTMLVSVAASLAVGLAMLGVHGAIAYSVRQRVREIGIRIALGANTRDVVADVVRWGATLAAVGVVLGIAGSLALARWGNSFLYGVESSDPVTLALSSALLVAVAVVACVRPAWQASRTDPAFALRGD
ncbi:MAG: FtsX-like permease family protein [Acidobacteria bacterium]|nr:FtsX-like permease family protein [Acidobacteriota bacterium]